MGIQLKTFILGFLLSFCATESMAQMNGQKTITSPEGNSLFISQWNDGARYSKYLVVDPNDPNSRKWWYAEDGSANRGLMEGTRATSTQEWCRVRYLYGDDVRIAPCWGSFMYSSHVITGIDGMHYELWFSPSSLSYFKIRNQELNVWYAHDGSANDGRRKTTKEDWCRVIFYHMLGIIKLPEECKDIQTRIVNSIAKTYGSSDLERARNQERELSIVALMMGETGRENDVTARKNYFSDPTKAAEFGKKTGLAAAGTALEEGYSRGIEGLTGRIPYDNLTIARQAGPNWTKPLSDTLSKNKPAVSAGQIGTGILVGVAVDYGVDAIKNAAGWKAKDANAGMIAAETITTTVASSAITTAVLAIAGASVNPATFAVGLVIAGGIAAGEEIKKASEDTGIRFENGYGQHIRYNRDLNGIHSVVFGPRLLAGSYRWEECSSEGGRCEFTGYRWVVYGEKPSDDMVPGSTTAIKAAVGPIDCNSGSFDGVVAPSSANRCYIPVYRGENTNWLDCGGEGEFCAFKGRRTVAYGVDDQWTHKEFTDGTTCSHVAFGYDPRPGKGKSCGVFLSRDEFPVWVYCGWEGETCNLPGTREIRYGTQGRYNKEIATDRVTCSYRNMGDPYPGVGKGCDVKFTAGELRGWVDCGGEGQRCNFSGTRVVRYGVGDSMNFRVYKDGVDCSVSRFGDPKPYHAKRCWVQSSN